MPDTGIILLLTVAVIICIFFIAVIVRDSNRFVIAEYKVRSAKLYRNCRIVMLSDLHNKEYGKDNFRLVQAVDEIRPDIIVIAGDMVTANEKKTEYTVPKKLIKQLAEKYPVYYGTGNHEYRMKIYKESYGEEYSHYSEELKKYGVRMLENERVFLPEINMEICGLELERCYYQRMRLKKLEEAYLSSLLGKSREDCYELLIAHNPDYFKEYAAWGADLTLAGHVHGGVMRLPYLGGVISPMMRLFPKYDGGIFKEYGKTMILGRGLGMHTIPIRIFNPGEIVVVDLEAEA